MSAPTAQRARDVLEAIGGRLDGRPLVILLDVDGTLAPIAPRPEDARVPDETTSVIATLAACPGVHVALVSGRAAGDAARMVPVKGLWTLGNHGMERRSPDGVVRPAPGVAEFEARVAAAARALAPAVRDTPGALVEDKRWTLSLHYRLVDDAAVPALMESARRVADDAGLRVTQGKKVMELRPPVAIDKGTATVGLAEELGGFAAAGTVLFAGDDRTDEDAFRALRARSARAVTVRVCGDPGETAAEFRLGDPPALYELLLAVARRATQR